MPESPVIPVLLDAVAAAAGAWLRPIGLVSGGAAARLVEAGIALPLAGGALAFTAVELLARADDGTIVSAIAALDRLRGWAASRGGAIAARIDDRLAALGAPRADWAGLALDRPLIMGIVNVTPDSFSDGGDFATPERAIAHGRALAVAGADIIDVGGESTRPGALPVAPEEEIRRVDPVIRALAATGAVVSIDTRHASVMAMALGAGARIVNDVTALAGDRDSIAVVARGRAPVVLMHMAGEPATMQHAPTYDLASLDVAEALTGRVASCTVAGIPADRIVIDPGIGFGKARRHNLDILARLTLFHGIGCAVMVGLSRKSIIGEIAGVPSGERLPGSLAGALHALGAGVHILRVHDVAETRQAVALWRAVNSE
jgi:dihydropteroate synthase